MYLKIDECNYDTLKKVSKITLTDYDITWLDAENIKGYIDSENLMTMIEDLLLEIGRLEEKYEDLEQQVENNYELKNVNLYEEYGVSERDFY